KLSVATFKGSQPDKPAKRGRSGCLLGLVFLGLLVATVMYVTKLAETHPTSSRPSPAPASADRYDDAVAPPEADAGDDRPERTARGEEAEAGTVASEGENVLGRWLDQRPGVTARITIYREDGAVYMHQRFHDGSSGTWELT